MPRPQKAKHQIARPVAPGPKERPAIPAGLLGVAGDPGNGQPDGAHPSWRLALLDLDHAGSWSWEVGGDDLRKIIEFLTQMERLTWAEVKAQMFNSKNGSRRKHHPMTFDSLCPEAQKRLRQTQLEGLDLFRFRLGNRERLWGLIHDGVFYPVWWDPLHQVYPADA